MILKNFNWKMSAWFFSGWKFLKWPLLRCKCSLFELKSREKNSSFSNCDIPGDFRPKCLQFFNFTWSISDLDRTTGVQLFDEILMFYLELFRQSQRQLETNSKKPSITKSCASEMYLMIVKIQVTQIISFLISQLSSWYSKSVCYN